MNKINGRTPEEIKLGLECCIGSPVCSECPYLHDVDCNSVERDALAYIQQLERERDEARNDLDTLNYANTELHGAYEAMKRERDAAVEALCEIDETLIKHNSTGTHGCMNEVRKAVNDGLIGVICAREVKPDEQIQT